MLLRRITKHVKDQNWFAVGVDFLVVVFGVYIGVWVGGFQDRKETGEKQKLVVEALRQDILFGINVESHFRNEIDRGLSGWLAAFENGERPPPYAFRVPGSDTPPQHIWNSLQQNQLSDLFSPDLIHDLGIYYSELDGVSRKYVRYIEFVENELLPGLKEDTSYFYRENEPRLKAKFEANMDRLYEWRLESTVLGAWGSCLAVRLENPTKPSESCVPNYSDLSLDADGESPWASK